MNYPEALQYIYSFADLERGVGFSDRSPAGYRFQRIGHLLHEIGDPHQHLRIAHIAGSNGKGSTSAMLAAIAGAAGLRVGLYTQPHLHTFRERIVVDAQPIAPDQFANRLEALAIAVAACRERHPAEGDPTTYEITTALAFQYFADTGVDLAVIEVGMGGTWDATNVVDPAVSVITSLSLEHTAILGSTLEAIAGEKAGIIKASRPVITVPQAPEAMQVIERRARELGAPLEVVGLGSGHPLAADAEISWANGRPAMAAGLRTDGQSFDLQIPLVGRHQLLNAATAVAAARELNIEPGHIARGLASTVWPARFELIAHNPRVIVDAAHSPDAIRQTGVTLAALAPGPVQLVFGAGADKDAAAMLLGLASAATRAYVCASNHPRAASPADLFAVATAIDLPALAFDSVAAALSAARDAAGPDGTVLVTGSIFVAAAAREASGLATDVDPAVLFGSVPTR
ncbi:MAG: Mur ligase family protein [Chloroflexota bacterium]|jgi:dihydrofolate synthase/folylpolyglutamate synthase|nr:Mur ligase family protein [Chloroflexota bacterium]MDP6757546.1 Mur ligase family protein [Chloroflexota bacterium]